MTTKIDKPTVVPAEGTEPKIIEEFVGRVNTGDASVSIARMTSPQGWEEPAQTPEFDEYTLVLSGMGVVGQHVVCFNVRAASEIHTSAGERVRYSTPDPGGAEYVAVCIPAFSPEAAHRDV